MLMREILLLTLIPIAAASLASPDVVCLLDPDVACSDMDLPLSLTSSLLPLSRPITEIAGTERQEPAGESGSSPLNTSLIRNI